MKTAVVTIQMLIRLIGLAVLILGILFWSGRALSLVPLHMLGGALFVLLLWVLALVAARARVGAGLVAVTVIWGLVVLVLGMTQTRLLTGDAHWLIQVLHLLISVGAIGLAERVSARTKRAGAA